MRKIGIATACLVVFLAPFSRAADTTATASVTGDPRVDALLSQMTLAEKLTLIHDAPEDPALSGPGARPPSVSPAIRTPWWRRWRR